MRIVSYFSILAIFCVALAACGGGTGNTGTSNTGTGTTGTSCTGTGNTGTSCTGTGSTGTISTGTGSTGTGGTSGSLTWAGTKQLGVAGTITSGRGVATDSNGNVYVVGYTYGGLDGNTLTGTIDAFLTCYDSAGTWQWTRQLGAPGVQTHAYGVATDSIGHVYVTGTTQGGLDGNTLTGVSDVFITQYDSAGTKYWTRQLGVKLAQTFGTGVATDSNGNVYVSGYTYGGLDGNTLTGAIDGFVTKYDSKGTRQWTRQFGVSVAGVQTYAYGVATDSLGHVYVTGMTQGGLDGNTLTGLTDLFLLQYSSTGTLQWARQLGVTGAQTYAYGVATDNLDHVYVTGYIDGGLDGNNRSGIQDMFVTQYDSTGSKLWTRQLGVAGATTNGYGVTTDSSGNVYVTGYTTGGLDGNTQSGLSDFFLTKYNGTGSKQWTRQLGVPAVSTEGFAVATDGNDNTFVTGETNGGLDGNTQIGVTDCFITKYDSTGVKQ